MPPTSFSRIHVLCGSCRGKIDVDAVLPDGAFGFDRQHPDVTLRKLVGPLNIEVGAASDYHLGAFRW